MINWILSILGLREKSGVYAGLEVVTYEPPRPVYDPSKDDERVLRGEVESFFD